MNEPLLVDLAAALRTLARGDELLARFKEAADARFGPMKKYVVRVETRSKP